MKFLAWPKVHDDVCSVTQCTLVICIDIYLSGLLARRQNAWSQDGGNMRVIANATADQYQDRPAGLLLWFVLVCCVV